MNMRKLGRSGLEIAPLALGGNVFGWTVDEPTSFDLLDSFVAEGFNLIDTANVYPVWINGKEGSGESEMIIGNWLRKRPGVRTRVLIATKVGAPKPNGRGGLSRSHIFEEAEASLQRLGTDYIDLYQSHFDDLTTPHEETLDAYAQLIREGKVRAIGASNHTAARLREALHTSSRQGYPRYESLQPLYNLYDRAGFEGELESLCNQAELAVIPYFSLANGFLTGKYRSQAEFLPTERGKFAALVGDTKSLFGPRGQRILDALNQISADIGATPAEISIAWLSQRVTAPLASATNRAQLTALMRGAALGLSAPALRLLKEACAPN